MTLGKVSERKRKNGKDRFSIALFCINRLKYPSGADEAVVLRVERARKITRWESGRRKRKNGKDRFLFALFCINCQKYPRGADEAAVLRAERAREMTLVKWAKENVKA